MVSNSMYSWMTSSENTVCLDESLENANKARTILVEPGIHDFGVRYKKGNAYTPYPNHIRYLLEAGKSYIIAAKIEGTKVVFDILDDKGKSLTNPNNYNTFQKSVLQYISVVLEPTSEGKTVHLRLMALRENWDCGPDMTITVENYATKEKTKGYIGFITDKELSSAKIYIKFDNEGTMTSEEFLNLKPEECDRVYEFKGRGDSSNLLFLFKPVKPKLKEKELVVDNIFTYKD